MNFRAFHPNWLVLVCLVAGILRVRGDSWARPSVSTNVSENGVFEFVVRPGSYEEKAYYVTQGIFRRKGEATNLWEGPLVNRIGPVRSLIPDSGRFVVTMDEWHSVGENPVVIYDGAGELVAHLTLEDLKLDDHPKISRSVSSYWWNEYAFCIFGPTNSAGLTKTNARRLEDMLFIRLHWGEIITIDLTTGAVRHGEWWQAPPVENPALEIATKSFLDRTWEDLAERYFRAENFEPDPSGEGTRGLMLSAQLKRKEAIPLMRKIAGTDRFQHWGSPPWDGKSTNLREYAQRALEEMEK